MSAPRPAQLDPKVVERTRTYVKVWLLAAGVFALACKRYPLRRGLSYFVLGTAVTYLTTHADLLAATGAREREARRPEIVVSPLI